ncbi:unnamed protein product [Parnassius apollo]|uniref:(apollo) hypothetical protein n=1 Tax=Parnassius apollo TaxID=110799 RepID=A0A8S3X6L0_PARAO|nr:unnamed protein product [Parnassius apollo]
MPKILSDDDIKNALDELFDKDNLDTYEGMTLYDILSGANETDSTQEKNDSNLEESFNQPSTSGLHLDSRNNESTQSHCRALEIPAVLDQALLLQSRWTKAQAEDPNIAFCRVRNPSCRQELNHANFPDLYYAAIAYSKLNKLVGENFQLSQTHISSHAFMIDKYIKKSVASELGEMSEDTKSKLMKLGYPIVTRRRHRTDSEDEEE